MEIYCDAFHAVLYWDFQQRRIFLILMKVVGQVLKRRYWDHSMTVQVFQLLAAIDYAHYSPSS